MSQIRLPVVANDISLAREVVGQRPSTSKDWEAVAAMLSSTFSTPSKPVHLKGRGCRERMERLLEKSGPTKLNHLDRKWNVLWCFCILYFLIDSSGTEEEHTELAKRLEEISAYQRDKQTALMKEKEAKRQNKFMTEELQKKCGSRRWRRFLVSVTFVMMIRHITANFDVI